MEETEKKELPVLIFVWFIMSVLFGSCSGGAICFVLYTTNSPLAPLVALAGFFFLLMFIVVICGLLFMLISAAVLFTPAIMVVIRRRQMARKRSKLLKLEDEFTKEMSALERDFFYRSVPPRFHWLKTQLEKVKARIVELK